MTSLLVSAAACLLALAGATDQAPSSTWEDLEARAVVIDRVEIVVRDVFDLSRPSENHWIGRAANAVHMDTRTRVIARELLFAAGEPVSARLIAETARNLRRHPFVREARIVPVSSGETSVTARVEVDDAWSLLGNVDVSRSGGNTEWSVRLDEVNVLGQGKRLFVEHERTIERHANQIGYIDPQFFGSRWVVSAGYSNLSDGASRVISAERPYVSIGTRYSLGGFVSTSDYRLTQYNHGVAVRTLPVERSALALFGSYAYRVSNRTALRVGAAYHKNETTYGDAIDAGLASLPAADTTRRRTRGISATWSLVEDRPVTFENMRSIGHTEDYNVGWALSVGAGYLAAALGSVTGAPSVDMTIRKAWSASSTSLLAVDAAFVGRREGDGWRNASGRATVTVYNQTLRAQTIAAELNVVSLTRPDAADWLYLGGRDGLRGYVDHFLAGDRRVSLSVEDRIITTWRPLGVVQAGFVAYLDTGVIRRADTARWSRTYANLGAGLRLGLPKSSRGELIHVSLAMPFVREPGLDRLVLVVGNTVSF